VVNERSLLGGIDRRKQIIEPYQLLDGDRRAEAASQQFEVLWVSGPTAQIF